MGWPDLVRGSGPNSRRGPVGLEGDWLDRFGILLGDRGRFAERQLVLPAPVALPGYPERRLDGAFDLRNAVWRLREVKPAWTPARCSPFAIPPCPTSDARG
jgi:hypothetical protein